MEIHKSITHQSTLYSKYPCDLCQRTLTQKSNLRAHLLTHESNPDLKYPFTCGSCQRKFTQKGTLRIHMLTHEFNPDLKYPFTCGSCPRKFI